MTTETETLNEETVPELRLSDGGQIQEDELSLDLASFIDSIELGEIELIEEATNSKISKVLKEFETQDYSASTLIAITWLALRRNDPNSSVEPLRDEIEEGLARARRVKLVQIADIDDEDDAELPQ